MKNLFEQFEVARFAAESASSHKEQKSFYPVDR